jgi:hypothetical protein
LASNTIVSKFRIPNCAQREQARSNDGRLVAEWSQEMALAVLPKLAPSCADRSDATKIRQSRTSAKSSPSLGSSTCAGRNDAFLANRQKARHMSVTLFIAAIAPLIAGVCIATGSNAQSKMSDAAYCQTLVKQFTLGQNSRGGAPIDLDASVAIAQCQQGNPGPAIPVLEQKLRDNGFTVPSRT